MSNKHTPGAWKVDPRALYIHANNQQMKICDIRGWGYLTGSGQNLPEKKAIAIQTANANLIAAAPDLLEALEQIVKCETNRRKDLVSLSIKPKSLYTFSDARVQKAQAAINKAKGQS